MQRALILFSLFFPFLIQIVKSQLLTDCTLRELLRTPPVLIEYFGCNEQSHKMTKIFYIFSQKLVESRDFFNFVTLATGRIDCDRTPKLCKPLPHDPCSREGGCGGHGRGPHHHGHHIRNKSAHQKGRGREGRRGHRISEWKRKLPLLELIVDENFKVFKGFLGYEELVLWVAKWLGYTPCWVNFMLTAVGISTAIRCQ